MSKESYVVFEKTSLKKLIREAKELFERLEHVLKHYIGIESDVAVKYIIVPVACEYYAGLSNYIVLLRDKLSPENEIFDKETNKKVAFMTTQEAILLQTFNSMMKVCEEELNSHGISIDLH